MYQISEVSKLVGLSIPTIRYYEKLGLIDPPEKNSRGYKVYDDKMIQYLGFIVNLKDTDMPLEQIKNYVDAYKEKDNQKCYSIFFTRACGKNEIGISQAPANFRESSIQNFSL